MVLQSSLLLTPENAGSLTWRTRWTPHWRPPSQRLHYFCTIDPDQHDKGLLCLHLHQPGDVWGGGADRRLSWPWLLRLLLLIKIFQHLVSWDRSLSHWTIWDVSLAFWLCLLNIAQFLNNYSVSCQTGPNGSLGLLTSTNTSFLFEQVPWLWNVECGCDDAVIHKVLVLGGKGGRLVKNWVNPFGSTKPGCLHQLFVTNRKAFKPKLFCARQNFVSTAGALVVITV